VDRAKEGGDEVMRSLFSCLATIGLACLISGAVLADNAFVKLGGIRIYSNLSYEPTEGDFSGDQILIIPSSDGDKILWRPAEGEFQAPLLLNVEKQGDLLKIKHPEFGDWTFQIKGAFLEGVSSKGVKIRLKQVSLK
jgi:hypothetical protein